MNEGRQFLRGQGIQKMGYSIAERSTIEIVINNELLATGIKKLLDIMNTINQ